MTSQDISEFSTLIGMTASIIGWFYFGYRSARKDATAQTVQFMLTFLLLYLSYFVLYKLDRISEKLEESKPKPDYTSFVVSSRP